MTDPTTPDLTYRDALRRHGRRAYSLRHGWRIGFVRALRRPSIHRNLWPVLASGDGRRWWTIGHGHSIFIGPLVVSWQTMDAALEATE